MNYYSKHLGDYAKKTGHLSTLEHGVYNLIMDGYYDREQGPTLVEATRWARARSEEEKGAVLAILDEFFILGPEDRYTQSRVEEELEDYRARAETNRGIAVERERKKRERKEHDQSTNRAPVVDEPSTTNTKIVNLAISQEPIANSHSLKTKAAAPSALPDWLPTVSWTGYLDMRKKQKKVPTDRAIELVLAELGKLHAAGQDIAAVLDKSTMKCWTDVYPILHAPRTPGPPPRASRLTESMGNNAVEFDDPFAKKAMT